MKIIYRNGTVLEAVTLQSSTEYMRVAVNGQDDSMEFHRINGVWVSEDCEPVIVETAINCKRSSAVFSEDDFICSPELAGHLIHLLAAGDEGETPETFGAADADTLRPALVLA